MTREQTITYWSASGSQSKRIAARLAREIADTPAGQQFESSLKTAARLNVSNASVVRARLLLIQLKLIHKSGSRYYTGTHAAGTGNN
jgi:hypothetical protein